MMIRNVQKHAAFDLSRISETLHLRIVYVGEENYFATPKSGLKSKKLSKCSSFGSMKVLN